MSKRDRTALSDETINELRSEILEFLAPVDAANPWCSEYAFDDLKVFESLKGLDIDDQDTRQALRDAISETLHTFRQEGVVEIKHDPTGEQFALSTALQDPEYIADQEAYANLKGAVLSEARKQGFKAKWLYRDGWRLVNHGGKIVAYGPISMSRAMRGRSPRPGQSVGSGRVGFEPISGTEGPKSRRAECSTG
jgi:hypothetical protein